MEKIRHTVLTTPEFCMSHMGHDRPIPHVRAMSVVPPIASGIADIKIPGFRPRMKGRASWFCPVGSDFDLLGYGKGIVYLDAEIPHGALNLTVTE